MKARQRHFLIFAIIFVLCVGIVWGQDSGVNSAPINNLGASQSGASIKVSWTSESESGVSHYEVHRSNDKAGPFSCVRDDITCRGNYQAYSIEDNCDLFKSLEKFLYYKVIAVYSDGTIKESNVVMTYYNSTSSAAKRTWGSIKAMFR